MLLIGWTRPHSLFYFLFLRDLMEVFPDAKVILTVREPKTWYKSVKSSIFQMRNLYKSFPFNILLWINGRWDHMRLVNNLSEYPGRGYTRGNFQLLSRSLEFRPEKQTKRVLLLLCQLFWSEFWSKKQMAS